jgi:glycolate oxidase FAD binding subunit
MEEFRPASEQELCGAMAAAAQARTIVSLGGAFSKQRMARNSGATPGVTISTAGLRRVLQYEPRDLTVSVEAGLPFAEFSRMLAEDGQMVPLDPPCFDRATVGGVVASNSSGPRRRLYGTARDMVIGMSFAKLDGKLAKSGGMVVKNVAGFDMAKLMIGSFGTLAAISVVNFKLTPKPPETRTFLLQFDSARTCMEARDRITGGVLQPAAMDALNPAAARRVGLEGFALLLQAGGSPRVMTRYAASLPGAVQIDGEREQQVWAGIREFTPAFVDEHPGAHVARVSGTLTETAAVFASSAAPVVARAASGVSYLHFDSGEGAREWTGGAKWRYVFEYGSAPSSETDGPDFEVMKAIKKLFDPDGILNPGRLYGRI